MRRLAAAQADSSALAATYTDADLAVIRDFLERNRRAMAAHGDALSRAGSAKPESAGPGRDPSGTG